MTAFPPLTHVALTVRDLAVSVPWYEALLDAQPVLDEDTAHDMHHVVYLLGNGTLFGLHQHSTPAPAETFSEFRVGLDHVQLAMPVGGEDAAFVADSGDRAADLGFFRQVLDREAGFADHEGQVGTQGSIASCREALFNAAHNL